MAAYLVLASKDEWEVLLRVLRRCEEGAILISPAAQEAFVAKHNLALEDGMLIDYDFGGEPDIMLDVLYSVSQVEAGSFPVSAILNELA